MVWKCKLVSDLRSKETEISPSAPSNEPYGSVKNLFILHSRHVQLHFHVCVLNSGECLAATTNIVHKSLKGTYNVASILTLLEPSKRIREEITDSNNVPPKRITIRTNWDKKWNEAWMCNGSGCSHWMIEWQVTVRLISCSEALLHTTKKKQRKTITLTDRCIRERRSDKQTTCENAENRDWEHITSSSLPTTG